MNEMTTPEISLTHYLQNVRSVIKKSFTQSVWVSAEITDYKKKNGNYYLELADKKADSEVLSKSKATIWFNTAQVIIPDFERNTGMQFRAGLKVLLKMRAVFHEQHGFTLTIDNIDPSFTLGEIAKHLIEIRNKLIANELYGQNKKLPHPFDIRRVIVISPANAAGLGDFQKEADVLQRSEVCSFFYHTATFQGEEAETAICTALRSALKQWKNATPPDLIVIIRGGGSVNDLASLNSYRIAEMICKRKVPVWVGIGHQKDQTILDEVAHQSFGTPSKVISGIRDTLVRHATQAQEHFAHIQHAVMQRLQDEKHLVEQIKLRTQTRSGLLIYQARTNALRYQNLTNTYFQRHIHQQEQQIEKSRQAIIASSKLRLVYSQQNAYNIMQRSVSLGKHLLAAQVQQIEQHYKVVRTQSQHVLLQQNQLVEQVFREILIQHPQRTLAKGYAIVRVNAQPLRKVRDAEGQIIDIEHQDGHIQAQTILVEENLNA